MQMRLLHSDLCSLPLFFQLRTYFYEALSIRLFMSIQPSIQLPISLPLHLAISPTVLHFFYIAHFDHLILTLDLKGVRLVGLITFQVDAVGLPVSSWVRRTETVCAAFESADRPALGEDRKVLGSIGIIVSHFYSWLGLPMERGRQGEGIGVNGTFKLPYLQFLVSKEKN